MDRESERLLKISEMRYRRLFEAAQDGILLVDHDTGMILDVNPFLIDMLGYSKSEFLKKHLWEVGAFKDVFASKKNFIRLKRKGYARYEDLPLETKDKRRISVEFVSNVYDVAGKKTIQCNIRDITAHKRLEDIVLLAKEQQFLTIFDNAPEGILGVDLKASKFRLGNETACRMLGYTLSEIKQIGVRDIHPKTGLPLVLKTFKKQVSGEIKLGRDLPVKRKDGSIFYADINAVPIVIDKKNYMVGFFHDTTERKMMEADLKRSKSELQAKVGEMGTFNKLSIGRELKMVELKKQIRELEEKLKKR